MTLAKLGTGLALVALLAVAGCRQAPLGNVPQTPYGSAASARVLTLDDYRNAIIRAGARRDWTFTDLGPGQLEGTVLVRGKHRATVTIDYTTTGYAITYKDSQNLNYDAATGQIHPNYNAWIGNLRGEITAEIATLRAS